MGRGRALIKCNIAIAGQYREYPYAKVSGWITNLGGNPSTSVNEKTTHVVASEKAWKRQDASVTKALKLIQEDEVDIKIVSYDWLEDSVNNKSKKREGPYLWQKLDGLSAKKDAARKREQKAKEPRKGHVGMMADVFQESTEKFVDPKEARKVEQQIEEERHVKKHLEEEEKKEKKEEERRKKAALFGHGAKRARNDLFTENYHIYADETNFRYDIVATKVDTGQNRNERYALTFQIYESNSEPFTYAFNIQFAGTHKEQKNTIMVPIGSPFAPAFRMFKKCFQEKTHVEWDDRIIHALERAKKEKRERGLATGSEDQGSRKGVAVSVQEEKERKAKDDKAFNDMPFEYHPPRFGSRGKLPKDKVPYELIGEKNTEIEHWMSGANGDGQEAPIDLTDGDAETSNSNFPVTGKEPGFDHFEAMMNDDNDTTNILERDLANWVDDNLDDLHPFDHTAENMEYLKETDAQLSSINGGFDFGPIDQTEVMNEIENQISFDQTDTNAAEHPISFDIPSIVQESFQPGTQDVSDTQMAERAQGEFEEFINQPIADEGTYTITTPTPNIDLWPSILNKHKNNPTLEAADNSLNTTATTNIDLGAPINFGSSILGKRKGSPNAGNIAGPEAHKKAKHDKEQEALAVAAEETFDADKAYQIATQGIEDGAGGDVSAPNEHQALAVAAEESFDADKAYQIATQAIEDSVGGDVAVPRAMQGESDLFSAAGVDEGVDVGEEGEMELFGE